MSKRQDPVLPVLKYFETAELPLAQQALALANAIVKKRAPGAAPRKSHHKARSTPSTTVSSANLPPATAN